MSRRTKKPIMTVALVSVLPGPIGYLVEDMRNRERKRIVFETKRKEKLGPIPDSKLKINSFKDIHLLKPADWKDHDHYAILGIGYLRHRATEDQIKKAHRKNIIKYHPDKNQGKQVGDATACINRAYDILRDPESRKAYDSVDPKFDDSVPLVNTKSKENFFEVFTPVFDLNERWSEIPDVPYLGDADSSLHHVNNFYEFWFNFKSWREYSYLDEEDKSTAEDADERRWIEKKNKKERAEKKKEEMKRLRSLVDNAFACDPRIKKFNEEEKQRKERVKKAKAKAIKDEQDRVKAEAEAARKKEEDERKAKEEAAKKEKDEAKRNKDRVKKQTKKARQKLENFCKSHDYFGAEGQDKIDYVERLQILCQSFNLMKLNEINDKIEACSEVEQAKCLVDEKLDEVKAKLDKEREEAMKASKATTNGLTNGKSNGVSAKEWSYEDLQILIKSVNMFPAGTVNRWKVVSTWVNAHGISSPRNQKDCLSRAKSLSEAELKAEANKNAFEKYKEAHHQEQVKNEAKPKGGEISQRFDENGDAPPRPWTRDEQKLLEQALKTYTAASNPKDRWEKIAGAIKGRSKRDCVIRYKELAAAIKAKKAAIAAAKKR